MWILEVFHWRIPKFFFYFFIFPKTSESWRILSGNLCFDFDSMLSKVTNQLTYKKKWSFLFLTVESRHLILHFSVSNFPFIHFYFGLHFSLFMTLDLLFCMIYIFIWALWRFSRNNLLQDYMLCLQCLPAIWLDMLHSERYLTTVLSW